MTALVWMLVGVIVVQVLVLISSLAAARARARRAEKDLEQSLQTLRQRGTEAARLGAGLGAVGEGVVLLDPDLHVVDWNDAAIELAGLPEQRGSGRRVDELLPWGRLHSALEECAGSALEERAAGPLEERARGSEAVQFDVLDVTGNDERTLVVRLRGLGGLGYVVTIDDQSRLRRLESMRRDFVANVSHELKTPLAAIKGLVDTLRDDPKMTAATRTRFIERISKQGERLNTLVGDLLTLSRLDETEGGAERATPCDLRTVTDETVRDLGSLADDNGLELSVQLSDERLLVRAEREGLRQVVSNLVDNAIKYTPAGGAVGVRLTATADQVRLEVSDTGIGLSPDDQERVFERFYRVDRARSRELGGTGLGLSIVKNTVRRVGGDVGVRSAIGSGSTFWVTLPRLPTDIAE